MVWTIALVQTACLPALPVPPDQSPADAGAPSDDAGHVDGGAADGALFDAGSDAGTTDAGPTAADAGVDCSSVAAAVSQLLAATQPCEHDSDCIATSTQCGLAGICGAYINTQTANQLDPLESEWQSLGCANGQPCPGCAAPQEPAICSAGACIQGVAAGQACESVADCPVLPWQGQYPPQCLSSAPFTNGDCVQSCSDGWGCPLYGLLCRSLPGAPHEPGVCFLQCSMDTDCRGSEGYVCCPNWDNGLGGDGSVCFPGPCPM